MNFRCEYLLAAVCLLSACDVSDELSWSRRAGGYYYRLVSFENVHMEEGIRAFALVDIAFATVEDSVFWDSNSNAGGSFFVDLRNEDQDDFLRIESAAAAERDSFELLVTPEALSAHMSGTSEVPYFLQGDTAVKVKTMVRQFLTEEEYTAIDHDPALLEQRAIVKYFGSLGASQAALDPAGFYWLSKSSETRNDLLRGVKIILSYRGYFLSGRLADAGESSVEVRAGEPGRFIEGLNYVMASLKPGQNAKIILPSALAFGSSGSSTGLVPPFTPLIYEIEISSEIEITSHTKSKHNNN